MSDDKNGPGWIMGYMGRTNGPPSPEPPDPSPLDADGGAEMTLDLNGRTYRYTGRSGVQWWRRADGSNATLELANALDHVATLRASLGRVTAERDEARDLVAEIAPTNEEMMDEAHEAHKAVLARLKPGGLYSRDDIVAEMEARRDIRRKNAALQSELSATAARLATMTAERDAWQEFALHQYWCAICGENVRGCPEGSALLEAAKALTPETT